MFTTFIKFINNFFLEINKKKFMQDKKQSVISYILIEFFSVYVKMMSNFFTQFLNIITFKNLIKLNVFKDFPEEVIYELKAKKSLNQELNKRLHYIREEFYENLLEGNKVNFKHEWSIFYKRTQNLHLLWLIYTQKPLYIVRNFFYIRQKNLSRTFNVFSLNAGSYFKKYNENLFNLYWGFISFWKALRIWVFSLFFFSVSFYMLLLKRSCVLPQTLFFWIGMSMLLYWLLSGFVFFVKKYQYSRYTSVIQRFWRRSYILFWLIESGLLLVFFYLTINATQESFYMFDQGYFLKTHLFSWKIFIFKCILIVALITYSYLLLLNLKWSTFNKNILNLVLLTILLLYLVWTEFYQIYWVSNFYANFSWLYDMEEAVWSLEFDARRTRILNHYIMILFLLKFWHIIFIFGCWVFFLLRSNELETITYPLYSFNYQNFIILFLMMWLFMFPWAKHTFHWTMEIPYFWFYVDTHISFYKILVNDLIYFYTNVFNYFMSYSFSWSFTVTDFINWYLLDTTQDCNVYLKSTIRDVVLKNLL